MVNGNDDFTIRDEANALTALAVRNGFLEDLHAGRHHEALDDPGVSRITDAEMKRLMIGISENLARLLHLKNTDLKKYCEQIALGARYCHQWDRTWPLPPCNQPTLIPTKPSDADQLDQGGT